MPSQALDNYLVLDGLSKTYGNQVAVSNLDLSIGRGEFVSLLGPSGCGKTTTLQMITGFVQPSGGMIRLDGKELTAIKPNKRELGIVFQSYALFPHLTAAQNVSFGLEMRGISRDECKRRVAETLDLVGLSGLADRYPRRMSGGQQQRVALARALVIRPAVLLLDEPLSNLDAKLREDMQIELRSIQRTLGTTTLLVTHDQSEAMALSNRIVVMNDGKIEQVGTPEEVYRKPATAFVAGFLGKTNTLPGMATNDAAGCVISMDGVLHKAGAGIPNGPVRVRVRPERICFSGSGQGLMGRVVSSFFHGANWLYQVKTGLGVVVVIVPNDGSAKALDGATVSLTWRVEDMEILPGTGP